MRQGPHSKRGRSRGGNRRSSTPNRNQTFDSNGPDVRIRGNAHQVHEKYLSLARDAAASGDRVLAESYQQHAEHYYRILSAFTDEVGPDGQRRGNGQHYPGGNGNGQGGYSDDDGDGDWGSDGDQPAPRREQGGEPFRGDGQRYDAPRNDQQRSDQNRNDRHQQDGNRQDGNRQDGNRQDGNRHDGGRQDGNRRDQQRFESGRQDQPRREHRNDHQRNDQPRPEPVRGDAQRHEQSRSDAVEAADVTPIDAPQPVVDSVVVPLVQPAATDAPTADATTGERRRSVLKVRSRGDGDAEAAPAATEEAAPREEPKRAPRRRRPAASAQTNGGERPDENELPSFLTQDIAAPGDE